MSALVTTERGCDLAPGCADPSRSVLIEIVTPVYTVRRSTYLSSQVIAFTVIGLLSSLVTAVLYALGRQWWSPLAANLVALSAVTVLNTEANRRFTFIRTGRGLLRVHAQSALVFLGYCTLTSLALLALPALVGTPSQALEVAVLLGASALGTVGRFLLLRGWVFAAPRRGHDR